MKESSIYKVSKSGERKKENTTGIRALWVRVM